jgi:hypothetical protein
MARRFSFDYKLERADQHLQTLKEWVERWSSRNSYAITDKLDAQTGENVVTIEPVGSPPAHIGMIIGDILYDLRSALDQLAYALAVKNLGEPLLDKIARGSEFPIYEDPTDYSKHRKRKIGGVSPSAQTVIDGLQPFNAGPDFRSHPLWLLNELSNIDKHRAPHLSAAHHGSTQIPGQRVYVERLHFIRQAGLLESPTEIIRYKAFPHSKTRRVNMKFNFVVDVVFAGEPVPNQPLTISLKALRDYAAKEVIPKLRPFL